MRACEQALARSPARIERESVPLRLCHVDPNPANAISGPDGRVRWVDWEYSGAGDPAYDLAELRWHPGASHLPAAWWDEALDSYAPPIKDVEFSKRLALYKHWKVVQRAPSRAQFPNGETFYECQSRVAGTLDAILSKHKLQDIVACVLHADPIKLAVAHYIGLPLDQFQRLGCDTGSISVLAIGEMGASLIKLNQRPPFDFLPKK